MTLRLSFPPIKQNIYDSLKKKFKDGYLVEGKYTKELEEKFKKYFKSKYAILISSCTSALHLSLISINIKKGDEVLVPAYSYIASANVVELTGATPVFVDINDNNNCIDVNKIEEKITKKTKAIIVVHEFGNPADMKNIVKIAKKFKLKIIEDGACALGSSYNNKKIGTFGEISCFSFHPVKIITTG